MPKLLKLGLLAAGVTVILPAIVASAGTLSFLPSRSFSIGDGATPTWVAIGDLNGDGKLDLATANYDSHDVSVLLGAGDGSFEFVTQTAAGVGPRSVAIGDFDGDGKLDLAVANFWSDDISVLLGTGSGSFGVPASFSVGIRPVSVAIGDFNGDGKLDLATTNYDSRDISVLLGNGDGSFAVATNFLVGAESPAWVAIGDLNGDGNPDLTTANSGDIDGDGNPDLPVGSVSVLLGSGSGSFGAPAGFSVGNSAGSVAIGDFNGDGNPDLATTNAGSNDVSVLLGDGNGSFASATNFPVMQRPYSLVVGDLNSDGNPDLAVSNDKDVSISILLGTGVGTFEAARNFYVTGGEHPNVMATGDFNGDGRPDLAAATPLTNHVSILLNTTTVSDTNTSSGRITGSLRFGKNGHGSFSVQSDADGVVKGGLEYRNGPVNIHAKTITVLAISQDLTNGRFAGILDDGRKFTVFVEDNGEPGTNDVFQLWIDGVLQNGDGQLGGNVQLHKQK